MADAAATSGNIDHNRFTRVQKLPLCTIPALGPTRPAFVVRISTPGYMSGILSFSSPNAPLDDIATPEGVTMGYAARGDPEQILHLSANSHQDYILCLEVHNDYFLLRDGKPVLRLKGHMGFEWTSGASLDATDIMYPMPALINTAAVARKPARKRQMPAQEDEEPQIED